MLALVFELGIVAVTLMSLLSSMRHPDRQASPEAMKQQHEQVVATLVSLGTTLVTFVLTMVGAGDAVKGLRTIGMRISAVIQRISAAGQRVSTAGQKISETGPIAHPIIDASAIDALPESESLSEQGTRTSNGGQV